MVISWVIEATVNDGKLDDLKSVMVDLCAGAEG